MSLKIGGVDPTKIMVAGTPATRIMIGTGTSAVQVWTAVKRTLTVATTISGTTPVWDYINLEGDTSILRAVTPDKLSFQVPVTPSGTVQQNPSGQVTEYGRSDIIREGEIMPAEVTVGARGSGSVTFTEV